MEEYMEIIEWLLHDSDPSIIYQVKRDLLKQPCEELEDIQHQIIQNGWGKELLNKRRNDGHWGNGCYNPKWTCTHYVLYELLQLEIPRNQKECKESAKVLLSNPYGKDGGINYAKTVEYSDVCINGMILTIAAYFGIKSEQMDSIIEYLLKVQMNDGGWNCEYIHNAKHSSLHTTISVLEGLETYLINHYTYRRNEIETVIEQSIDFILRHYLFRSETTGEIIKDEFLKYTFPIRWKYDILRCLDLFRKYDIQYDERMEEAFEIIERTCNKNGRWKAYTQPGKTYFILEKPGSDSKWNTLRALRVLIHYNKRHAFV